MSKQGVKPLLDHGFELYDLLLGEHRIERGSAHAVNSHLRGNSTALSRRVSKILSGTDTKRPLNLAT